MSKRINFATINSTAIKALSDYNMAMRTYADIKTAYDKDLADLASEREEIIQSRIKALEGGKSGDEFSLVDIDKKINVKSEEAKSSLKKLKVTKNKALRYVTDDLYRAYLLAMEKGSMAAKGTFTLKEGKEEKVYTVNLSYTEEIKAFAEAMGFSKADNETALNKFADFMKVRAAGRKATTRNGFAVNYSANQFKKVFIHNILQILIHEAGVLVENEDHTLSRRNFETAE